MSGVLLRSYKCICWMVPHWGQYWKSHEKTQIRQANHQQPFDSWALVLHLTLQCCLPQQWGMVLPPVHLPTAPVKVQNHNCVSAESIWVTVLGKALGFLLTAAHQGHWQNVPDVLGVVAMAGGAVHRLGTSPGRGFVEVTDPSQLTSTTHMSS